MPAADMLARYADVAIRIGLGLEKGHRLLIRSSIDAADLTRHLVVTAYAAGASNVDVLWGDDRVSRARFDHGTSAATEVISSSTRALLAAFEAGDQLLSVVANDPDAMAGIDSASLARFEAVNQAELSPLYSAMGTLQRRWSVIAASNPAWAQRVFPDADADDAVERLWSAIFRACRIDQHDPVAAWQVHVADLNARSVFLTARQYTELRYEATGTDLTLGLPDEPLWVGGSAGGSFVPNIPTEEVFTAPHKMRGEGIVQATKPLSLFGQLVDDFAFEVSDGEIVKATAGRGQAVLDQLLATGDGSTRLGEAAMVPMSSAVAAEGLVWNNTLYDENDGCHLAIGRAYPISIAGGAEMTPAQLAAAGLNMSTTHVDFVVGSAELNVYGVTHDGVEEPIIVAGEWGFTP